MVFCSAITHLKHHLFRTSRSHSPAGAVLGDGTGDRRCQLGLNRQQGFPNLSGQNTSKPCQAPVSVPL
ncbi:MAG: hypothetical protein WCA35_31810 [Kovacikia sp.]